MRTAFYFSLALLAATLLGPFLFAVMWKPEAHGNLIATAWLSLLPLMFFFFMSTFVLESDPNSDKQHQFLTFIYVFCAAPLVYSLFMHFFGEERKEGWDSAPQALFILILSLTAAAWKGRRIAEYSRALTVGMAFALSSLMFFHIGSLDIWRDLAALRAGEQSDVWKGRVMHIEKQKRKKRFRRRWHKGDIGEGFQNARNLIQRENGSAEIFRSFPFLKLKAGSAYEFQVLKRSKRLLSAQPIDIPADQIPLPPVSDDSAGSQWPA